MNIYFVFLQTKPLIWHSVCQSDIWDSRRYLLMYYEMSGRFHLNSVNTRPANLGDRYRFLSIMSSPDQLSFEQAPRVYRMRTYMTIYHHLSVESLYFVLLSCKHNLWVITSKWTTEQTYWHRVNVFRCLYVCICIQCKLYSTETSAEINIVNKHIYFII